MFQEHFTVSRALLIGLLLLTVSCSDSLSTFDDNDPPDLPPASSMEINFAEFEQEQAGPPSSVELAAESENYSHFGNAAVRVLVMKAVVNLNLALPRALLSAAGQAEPQQNEHGEWVWAYTRTADDKVYEVRLVASRMNENEVRWWLFVTNPDLELEYHLFFEGVATQDGRSGSWVYYELAGEQSGDPVSELSWSVEDEEHRQLRLEILTDRNGHMGDYIEYEFDAPVKQAIYYNAGQDETTEIGWDTQSREGYLMAPNYQDGERVCWDTGLANTPCS